MCVDVGGLADVHVSWRALGETENYKGRVSLEKNKIMKNNILDD